MKKFVCAIAVISLSILMLTGCGSIPNLDAEQEEMVSEYAVSLLLKYDSENHSRLVNVDSYINAYETAKKIHDQAEEAYYKRLAEEEEKRREEAEKQDELNSSYSQETPSQGGGNSSSDGGSGSSSGRGDGTGGATVVDARTIEDFLELEGFSVEYAGFDVMDIYPATALAQDFVPYISVSEGGNLCVVYFDVTNTQSADAMLDTINMIPLPFFKFAVNGENRYVSAVKTILEDDFSMYSSSFSAGETKRLVIVFEVREGTEVTALNMRITRGGESLTKSLR